MALKLPASPPLCQHRKYSEFQPNQLTSSLPQLLLDRIAHREI
jgi:hypothetical protein